jgi:glutamate-5-semialdehyde dehydrogenase
MTSFDSALALECLNLARRARESAGLLACESTAAKDRWLHRAADELLARQADLLAANEKDLAAAREECLPGALIDRLKLTPERLRSAAASLREVAALADPVGQVRGGAVRPNGLEVVKVGVPLGVILFVYESRPNVTLDAAALCVKSGNAVILRGGKEAIHSNTALYSLLRDTLGDVGLPADSVQLVTSTDREAVGHLLTMGELIDLVIPRGGEELIRRVSEEARMPVLKHYKGICHVFVEQSADLEMARRIVVNSKCQRPGVCNAAETLLIDLPLVKSFLPDVARELIRRGVELRGCPITCERVPEAIPAEESDYRTEYLDLILSVRVVNGIESAIEHINANGSKHTDAIVTTDVRAARRFTSAVDSAAVLVNASTRFHDGYELGLGAEIGISTDKFHARGPCGLLELTSYKYVIYGDGQVRG